MIINIIYKVFLKGTIILIFQVTIHEHVAVISDWRIQRVDFRNILKIPRFIEPINGRPRMEHSLVVLMRSLSSTEMLLYAKGQDSLPHSWGRYKADRFTSQETDMLCDTCWKRRKEGRKEKREREGGGKRGRRRKKRKREKEKKWKRKVKDFIPSGRLGKLPGGQSMWPEFEMMTLPQGLVERNAFQHQE